MKLEVVLFTVFLAYVVAADYPRSFISTLRVDNGARWGTWRETVTCPHDTFAVAYRMKIEKKQGSKKDDTSLNNIALLCKSRDGKTAFKEITSPPNPDDTWGDWKVWHHCKQGTFLTGYRLQVQEYQGYGIKSGKDDTAVNYMKFECRKFSEIGKNYPDMKGEGFWGDFGTYSSCPLHSAICGMTVRYQEKQGKGDDSALNDVQFQCCSYCG